MKITQKQLKQIIKEEVEASIDEGMFDGVRKMFGMKNKKATQAIERMKNKIGDAEEALVFMKGQVEKHKYNSLLRSLSSEIGAFREQTELNAFKGMNDNQKTEAKLLIDKANRLHDKIKRIRDEAPGMDEGLTREALKKIVKEEIEATLKLDEIFGIFQGRSKKDHVRLPGGGYGRPRDPNRPPAVAAVKQDPYMPRSEKERLSRELGCDWPKEAPKKYFRDGEVWSVDIPEIGAKKGEPEFYFECEPNPDYASFEE